MKDQFLSHGCKYTRIIREILRRIRKVVIVTSKPERWAGIEISHFRLYVNESSASPDRGYLNSFAVVHETLVRYYVYNVDYRVYGEDPSGDSDSSRLELHRFDYNR